MAMNFVCSSLPMDNTKSSYDTFRLRQYQPCRLSMNSFAQINYSPLRNKTSSVAVRAMHSTTGHEEARLKGSVKGEGLGIVHFLKGKSILVTGATGFLAKVVIEKILRTQPQVGKLFLIIKANDLDVALERLKKEIIYSELFRNLRDVHGNGYEAFMLEKLVPIVGNLFLDNLGVDKDVGDKISQEVDIILNSAANTTLNERYDVSLNTNTKGPSSLMEFGRRCKRLQVFLHISTVYVNGKRQGKIVEKPLSIGDSIAKELHPEDGIPPLDISEEFALVNKTLSLLINGMIKSKSHEELTVHNIAQIMKDVGVERARKYGGQNVYLFSKAMGEMLLGYNRGDIPITIVRPSCIESTYNDPFPGWIEGFRVVDPIIAYYGKGQLTGMVADPNVPMDIIPADMVANAILAAIAKHAAKPGLEVYHVGSSGANPIATEDVFKFFFEHFKSHPYVDVQGKEIQVKEPLKCFDNMEDFASQLFQNTNLNISPKAENGSSSVEFGRKERMAGKLVESMTKMADMYKAYLCLQARFDNSNTQRLYEEMSEDEKKIFGFDVKNIDWKDYLTNIHIPGFRRHVMKGRGTKVV